MFIEQTLGFAQKITNKKIIKNAFIWKNIVNKNFCSMHVPYLSQMQLQQKKMFFIYQSIKNIYTAHSIFKLKTL
jgi:hypothetical protein